MTELSEATLDTLMTTIQAAKAVCHLILLGLLCHLCIRLEIG